MNSSPSLVLSPSELHHLLIKPPGQCRIIPMAAGNASTLASFESRHLPNSVFFNMDAIRDTQSRYPMMLPSEKQFTSYMTSSGIRSDDILVVYDAFETGLRLAPRVAWTCRYFGHSRVYVLNNFTRYAEDGFPVSKGALCPRVIPNAEAPIACLEDQFPTQATNVIAFEELRQILRNYQGHKSGFSPQIVDARPQNLYESGHMPYAINIPFPSILAPDKTLLPPAVLKDLFLKAGVSEDVPIVLSCNSGVTAAGLDLALRQAGLRVTTRLYDGSWSEWADQAEEGLVVK
ncbi:Rhodanese-like protein [Penicillium herquei]|nr:Rhodanese-like protein [Penicillium herquei]